MEHNRLEIILLASGILVLVTLLSVILWLGNRKRNQEQRRNSAESQRLAATTTHTKGRDCLFREVFPNHRDHGSPLTRLGEYYNDAGGGGPGPSRSFVRETRRRSRTFAGEQHELRDVRHELGNERGRRGDSFGLVGVEDDAEAAGMSGEESKSDAEASAGGSGEARQQGTRTRRRTSSAVRLHGLKPPGKSQDHPLTGREKG
ncbi:hypothetical protein GE09DRAFT_577491 [Coniochaeta sp. 2T2.1]|nr:hypothetical protein GE09DRAFT_577491 [Coniochaeta sp. 2T2.1]